MHIIVNLVLIISEVEQEYRDSPVKTRHVCATTYESSSTSSVDGDVEGDYDHYHGQGKHDCDEDEHGHDEHHDHVKKYERSSTPLPRSSL